MPNMLMAIGTVELPMPLMAPTATSDMPIIKYVPPIILSRDTPQAMDSTSPLAYILMSFSLRAQPMTAIDPAMIICSSMLFLTISPMR